ncbi:MAG: OmpA family protein [Proteobacteria bacterium]|nr:OmpA family protein [Pseudomonadota bacterium]
MSGDNSKQTDPNAWMVTFGDLIMLLLTFFVLLLTMKSMDKRDTNQMFDYFIEAEDSADIGPYKPAFRPQISDGEQLKPAQHITSNAMLKKTLKSNYYNFRKYYDVHEDERGLVVTLGSEHLFDPGMAEIRPGAVSILDLAGNLLADVSNEVLILGHTDNTPLRHGKFRSNWELSSYRALNVYHYLTEEYGISPGQLAPGGYGDTRPAHPNTSPENRAKNRRVEFILKK